VHRFVVARRNFDLRGRFTLLLLIAMFLFGAGEEISWASASSTSRRRASLPRNNAQKEMNLHNLTFDLGGKTYKVNRLILAAASPSFSSSTCSSWPRSIGATPAFAALSTPGPCQCRRRCRLPPMSSSSPSSSLIDSPKRGEMTEFAGVIVILLTSPFRSTGRSTAPRA
jgi:hypothetical protein